MSATFKDPLTRGTS